MRNYIKKLIAHEEWANDKLISALQAAPEVPPRALHLVRHLFAAHELWNKRCRGEDVREFNAWPEHSLEECAALNRSYAETERRYVDSLPDPLEAQIVSFIGLDREPHTFHVVDALTQIHAHSVHHRGQIAADMRASGREPVPTDYIRFCMELEQPA